MAMAAGLLAIGLLGVLTRRNLIFMLVSVEVMLNAAALAFIIGGARWASPDAQVMFMLVISVAAVEAAVGLALILRIHHGFGTVDADSVSRLRG